MLSKDDRTCNVAFTTYVLVQYSVFHRSSQRNPTSSVPYAFPDKYGTVVFVHIYQTIQYLTVLSPLLLLALVLVALVGEGKGPGCGFKFAGSRSRVPYSYAFGAQNHTVIRAPNCTTTMLLVVLQNIVICVDCTVLVPYCNSNNILRTVQVQYRIFEYCTLPEYWSEYHTQQSCNTRTVPGYCNI